ncbi:hypothetical protein JAAARDRAFT_40995 [Jaapia argillacea MUCL 33604]|uniref:Uncharacterized protein n=1 Tax=Jaapia argillacea MUCL 33604 TaxID=933084 RepID=A0A067PCJ4_9AGAM|nr:hypothetical protein JAAARDRAFT_40995 [Jaapia argillacea MUCL 33604]
MASERTGVFWRMAGVLPFSSYPVSKGFRQKRTVALLAFAAILLYSSLTLWNILTQGKSKVYSSILMDTFSSSSTTACTARTISVGDTLYTSPSGNFRWAVTNTTAPGGQGKSFLYGGAPLVSNITFVSLLYYFAGQSYQYEVCAEATVPTLKAITTLAPSGKPDTIVQMCANFDITRDSFPGWSTTAQGAVQNKIYGIAAFLPQLNFASGVIPQIRFPPYGQQGGPPPNDTSITPSASYDLSIWLDGIDYLPNPTPSTGTENSGFGATHPIVLRSDVPGANDSMLDIGGAFEATVEDNLTSGMVLNLNGVGGVRLQTQLLNSQIGFTEPAVWTNMRNYSLSTLNLILDIASNDVNARGLESSYLCTVTSEEWKSLPSMVAMILGNNAALFGLIFGMLVAFAGWRQDAGDRKYSNSIPPQQQWDASPTPDPSKSRSSTYLFADQQPTYSPVNTVSRPPFPQREPSWGSIPPNQQPYAFQGYGNRNEDEIPMLAPNRGYSGGGGGGGGGGGLPNPYGPRPQRR